MNYVTLTNACVTLQNKRILSEISWQWQAHQNWWVTGENGAGKSTFLKLVVGQCWPERTELIDDRSSNENYQKSTRRYCFDEATGERTDLAYVLNEIALVSTQTQAQLTEHKMSWLAEDIIWSGFLGTHTHSAYNRKGQNKSILQQHTKTFKSVCEALRLTSSMLNQPFLTLSNGQQARCLVARALVLQPKCLAIDEIFNGIDETNMALIIQAIQKRVDSNALSIIIASHELPNAFKSIITHALTIKEGKIESTSVYKASSYKDSDYKEKSLSAEPQDDGIEIDNENASCFQNSDAHVHSLDNADYLLKLNNIKTYYDNELMLDIDHWQLGHAQHCLIKGENGSGKSTLIKLIYGDIKPSTKNKGQIDHQFTIDSNENYLPHVLQHRQKKMAFISPLLHQSYHHYYTIREVVMSGFHSSIGVLDHQTYTVKMTQKVDALIDEYGLSAIADKGVRTVSEGQLHRALLARAMTLSAQLFLLDEVDQFLDKSSKQRLFNTLQSLSNVSTKTDTITNHQRTIVLASHYLNEDNCPSWIKRVIYLKKGRIVRDLSRQ